MVLNATLNNISAISRRSDLLVVYPEKTTDLPQVSDKLHQIMLCIVPENGSLAIFRF